MYKNVLVCIYRDRQCIYRSVTLYSKLLYNVFIKV